jgi:hypothetical protein
MFSSILQKAGFKPGHSLRSSVPKLLMTAVMIGGAGSLLSAGSANAAIIGNFGNSLPSDLQPGDVFTNGDKILTLLTLPTEGSGNIDFDSNTNLPPPGPENDTWNVAVNFTPNRFGPSGNVGLFGYKFEIDQVLQPFAYFKQIALDTVHGGTGPSASKFVYASEADYLADTNLNLPFAGRVTTLVSLNGIGTDVALPFNTYKTLWIRDSFTPGANGDLKTLNNEYTQGDSSISRVPGPLPLLGAGMALGFSRKLRSRIKGSVKA